MRPLSGSRFAVTVGWRIAAFVAVSLAVPAIAVALASATGCAGGGAACWAVSVLTGTVLRPLILFIFALSLVRPAMRRIRSLGMPAAIGLVVPVLILLDWRFLTVLGARWSVSFDLGILNSQLPFFAILALAIIVALAVAARPADADDSLWRRHGPVGKVGWIAVLAATVCGAVSAGLYLAWIPSLATEGMASPLFFYAFRIGRIASSLCLAAMIPLLWIIARELSRRPRRTVQAGAA